jgi:hypothetical protein
MGEDSVTSSLFIRSVRSAESAFVTKATIVAGGLVGWSSASAPDPSRAFAEIAGGNGFRAMRRRLITPSAASHEVGIRPNQSGHSSNPLLLFGHRNAAGLCLGLGLGKEAEACLAPCEINAHIQQCIGTPTRAGEFHDGEYTVGFPGSQRHRPARDMVRRGIDA